MNWSCRFTVVDVSLPVEKEVEWRAAVKLLLAALERVDNELAGPYSSPSPECGQTQSGEGGALENAVTVDGTATGQILT